MSMNQDSGVSLYVVQSATGTAAALCIQDRISSRRLDVGKLQERLRIQGVEP